MEHLINGLVKRDYGITMIGCPGSLLDGLELIEYPKSVMDKEGQDRIIAAEKFISGLGLKQYDLIHNHMGGSIASRLVAVAGKPVVTTLHGKYVPTTFDEHKQSGSYVAISNNQVATYPDDTNIIGMVYNAIDFNKYDAYAHAKKYNYLTNINRYSPTDEKGFLPTLRLAEKFSSTPFILSMFVQPKFENDELLKQIRDKAHSLPNVIMLNGVTEYEKLQIVSRAKAFVFPLTWKEPFGLAPVEAQALGTPAIVRNIGSMSEVVKDGYSGFVIPNDVSITEFANRIINDLDKIDPLNCIRFVKGMFSIDKMVSSYENIYEKCLDKN